MRDYTPTTPLHRKILQKANALFAISNDVIRHHSDMVKSNRFRLTYNYINPDPILAIGKEHISSRGHNLPFAQQQPVIGLVGRITPYKQPDLFIRAAQHVLNEVPEARFVLIGAAQEREKSYEESIHALASDLGIKEKIAFLGQRRDAVALTSEFTIACLTSGREPLGRVILEAHLLGVPVIVPDAGGPAEIVQNEVTGLYFSSRAADADIQLARQITRLLQDKQLRLCLASKGKEHVLSTFASHLHVKIQEDTIDELCDTYTRN
jgi:glycosyltransferase involved in cell wall biosynthesis